MGAAGAGAIDGVAVEGVAVEGAVPKELGFDELGFEEVVGTELCAGQNVETSSKAIPAVHKRGVMGHLRRRFFDYTSGTT